MRFGIHFLAAPLSLTALSSVFGQGTFQNLNFEAANLPVIPPGQFGTFQPIGSALPFWNAYVGTNQITQVLHNNFFIGTPFVSILGPDWEFRIDGAYTVLLQPGFSEDVSIGQTGLIPIGTESIRFKGDPVSHHFGVSIGATAYRYFCWKLTRTTDYMELMSPHLLA
jgi:hypothetical protein